MLCKCKIKYIGGGVNKIVKMLKIWKRQRHFQNFGHILWIHSTIRFQQRQWVVFVFDYTGILGSSSGVRQQKKKSEEKSYHIKILFNTL